MNRLLLQLRDADDPMGLHERGCFAARLGVKDTGLTCWNLLHGAPPTAVLADAGMVLIGGSGDYSVVKGGAWLAASMDTMRFLVDLGTPTFASCWGFQALSMALGGDVQHLPERGHVGTFTMPVTPAGREDAVFRSLGENFAAQFGHEDVVVRPPDEATPCVLSHAGDCMAWRLRDRPVWGTQFHPELTMDDLLLRLRRYPKYVAEITGLTMAQFETTRVQASPDADDLLQCFAMQA